MQKRLKGSKEYNTMSGSDGILTYENQSLLDGVTPSFRRFNLSRTVNEDAVKSYQPEIATTLHIENNKHQTISTVHPTPRILNTISERSDEVIWQTKLLNNAKSRRKSKKSNWIQNFMGIIRNSKVLLPGESNDIKEGFNYIKESTETSTSSEHSINETNRSKIFDDVWQNRNFNTNDIRVSSRFNYNFDLIFFLNFCKFDFIVLL